MARPRLFLVAPETLSANDILACVQAASEAGDVASIVMFPEDVGITTKIQELGIAVLVNRDSSLVTTAKCDGAHINAETDSVATAREDLGDDVIIGAYCGASRDLAMQAAEDGASYVALSQNAKAQVEPIIAWWSELFEVPCVAYDPVTAEDATIVLSQRPDFIRPSDEMWSSPEAAQRVITDLMKKVLA